MTHMQYPASFPTKQEESFLHLLLCADEDFSGLWDEWKKSVVFDNLPMSITRLYPMVYNRMQKLALHDDIYFPRIKGVYKFVTVKNNQIFNTARSLQKLVGGVSIPILFLKGIPLLSSVYKNLSARMVGDIDILVDPKYAPALLTLLQTHGWVYKKPDAPEVRHPVASMYHVMPTTDLVHPNGVKLDIHWRVFSLLHHVSVIDLLRVREMPYDVFGSCCWENAQAFDLGNGVRAMCPSIEDMFIHVLVHGAEANDHRPIRWVIDSIALLRANLIDWKRVLYRTKDSLFVLELLYACQYLVDRFHVDIPSSFLDELSSLSVSKKQKQTFFRRTSISHNKRFFLFGNAPLIWYAYWRYEKNPKTLSGFFAYLNASFGVDSFLGLIMFIVGKCRVRISKLLRISL